MSQKYPQIQDYQFLIDTSENKTIYQEIFELGHSFTATWSPYVIFWYAYEVFKGRQLEPADGDPHQMGGDFLFDKTGTCLIAHRSSGPLDRIRVEDVISTLIPLSTTPFEIELQTQTNLENENEPNGETIQEDNQTECSV